MKIQALVALGVLVSLLQAASANAAEKAWRENTLMPKKDNCLLYAKNCQDNFYKMQQRVEQLQGEIFKGTTVYTKEELKILKRRLNDANKTLEFLINEGA